MTIDALIILAGMLVTVIPFLGFPLRLDNVLLVVLGVIVIVLGIIVRRRGLMRRSAINKGNGSYVDSVPRDIGEAHAE